MVGSKCRDFKNREVSNVNAPIVYVVWKILPPIRQNSHLKPQDSFGKKDKKLFLDLQKVQHTV